MRTHANPYQRAKDFVEGFENLKIKGNLRKATFDQGRYVMKKLREWFDEEGKVIDTEDYYKSIKIRFHPTFQASQARPAVILRF